MALKNNFWGVYQPSHKIALFCFDIVAFTSCFAVATQMRLDSSSNILSLRFIGITIITLAFLFIGGAYTSQSINAKPKLPLNTFFVVLISTPLSLLFIYILGPQNFSDLLGRGVYPFAISSFGILAVINRYLLNYFFQGSVSEQKILLLCESGISERLELMLKMQKSEILLTHCKSLNNIQRSDFNALIIGPDFQPNAVEQKKLLDFRLNGMPIYSLSDFFENFFFLVPVQEINNDWFIRSHGFSMLHSSITVRLKRLSDIVGALTLAFISLPVVVLTALTIKLTSKGLIFFTQTRVGMHGEGFTIYKFRTMTVDAESMGAQWASENDDRIIPLGHFFRKTRIDELPQVWNILKGDMSIVGPRPERPEFTKKLSQDIPYYDLRHVIKPGLTGWAQVNYPYGASTEDALRKLQFDLYYIKNHSMVLDLNILLRTIRITLQRSGR